MTEAGCKQTRGLKRAQATSTRSATTCRTNDDYNHGNHRRLRRRRPRQLSAGKLPDSQLVVSALALSVRRLDVNIFRVTRSVVLRAPTSRRPAAALNLLRLPARSRSTRRRLAAPTRRRANSDRPEAVFER